MTKPKEGKVKPILSFDDLVGPSAYISVDGEAHILADPKAFSLRQRAILTRASKRLADLEGLEEPSEADEQEYHQHLLATVRLILPSAPEASLDKLNDGQLGEVVLAFFGWMGKGMKSRLEILNQIGAQSSPASSGSTEEAIG